MGGSPGVGGGGQTQPVFKARPQGSCRPPTAYRRGSVRVNEVVLAADVVEADPGCCGQVSCGPEPNLHSFSIF